MGPRPTRLLAGALAAATLAALAACGGGDGPVSAVDVPLGEWTVTPERSSAPAGQVRFTTTNSGDIAHELVIIRTDLPADGLPTRDDGAVDEAAVEVVGRVPAVAPGDFRRGTFDLEAGRYVLVCNIVDVYEDGVQSHYDLGMRAEFTVTKAGD